MQLSTEPTSLCWSSCVCLACLLYNVDDMFGQALALCARQPQLIAGAGSRTWFPLCVPLWRRAIVTIIFTVKLRPDIDLQAYNHYGARMIELVEQHPGFISRQSWTTPESTEITIARFASEDAMAAWRAHPEHRQVQQLGRSIFYESYRVEVCTTIREYEFHHESDTTRHPL